MAVLIVLGTTGLVVGIARRWSAPVASVSTLPHSPSQRSWMSQRGPVSPGSLRCATAWRCNFRVAGSTGWCLSILRPGRLWVGFRWAGSGDPENPALEVPEVPG